MATGTPRFSKNDLALIRMAPRATFGGRMVLPSGFKTNGQAITLGDDFEKNVALVWSIVADDEPTLHPPTSWRERIARWLTGH